MSRKVPANLMKYFMDKHRFQRTFLVLACLMLTTGVNLIWSVPLLQGQQRQPKEYDVKAAFIFNFAKFVEWPNEGQISNWRVCLVGTDPFGAALDELDGKIVKEKKMAVKRDESLNSLKNCQMLFISSSEKERLKSILAAIKEYNVLTISDTENFARQGVMINFYVEDNKVRFEINADAVRRTGLKITSKLLRLARLIHAP
jgi:hypothetical protein